MDARARMARDKFVPLDIRLRRRSRIVGNPALDLQARIRAMEEKCGHAILSGRRRQLLLT
jgi:hypothetical protein